jgi:hypothetical protein
VWAVLEVSERTYFTFLKRPFVAGPQRLHAVKAVHLNTVKIQFVADTGSLGSVCGIVGAGIEYTDFALVLAKLPLTGR